MSTELTGAVAEHIAAVNAFDTDAIVATFAGDAYVNDVHREIAGIDAIRGWVRKGRQDHQPRGHPQHAVAVLNRRTGSP